MEEETLKQEIKEIEDKIEKTREILKNPDDQDLFDLAKEDLESLIKKKEELENETKQETQYSNKAVIIEIRAGVGGEEASLFAGDLFRMYSKFAQAQNWKLKILDSRKTDLKGYKEIVFEISPTSLAKQEKNTDIWSTLKYEAGVHRVQRIPRTEKAGRVHTSTISVAVLLKPKKTDVKIKSDEIRVDLYKASGPGGQYVNKRETAVRMTHLPTGIVVTSQTERNQLENKENALSILEAKILEKKKREEEEMIKGKRKAQIGWAKRSEKIRTYNFPQDRITDHRIKKSWYNLEKILDGNLKIITNVLAKKLKQE